MEIEFEAKYLHIQKREVRHLLKLRGARLVRPEFLQKRSVFHLPPGNEIKGGWLRVRDEGEKISLSLKVIDGNTIENQKELYLEIDNFTHAELLLTTLGCRKKAYQENLREIWDFDGVEIMIDEWPFLEPFVEVEGKSKEAVIRVSETMGWKYSDALFCSVGKLYNIRYGISEEQLNNHTPLLTFQGKNPFIS